MEKNKTCQSVCELGTKCRDCLSKLTPWIPLLLRVTIGIVFMQSGWGKLHNLEKVTEFFTELGIPMASIQAPFIAGLEFVGGLAILLGVAVRFFSFMLACTMIVAILTAKMSSFTSVLDLFGTQEWDYLVMCITLMAMGSGRLSLCGLCCRWKKDCCKT